MFDWLRKRKANLKAPGFLKRIKNLKKDELKDTEDKVNQKSGFTSQTVPLGKGTGNLENVGREQVIKIEQNSGKRGPSVTVIISVITVVAVLGLIVGGLMQIPAVTAVLELMGADVQFQEAHAELSERYEYGKCYAENIGSLTQFASLSTGGTTPFERAEEICDKLLGVEATQIGCTECYLLNLKAETPSVLAGTGQEAVVRATIDLHSQAIEDRRAQFSYSTPAGESTQPLLPAANPEIIIVSDDGVEAELEFTRCVGKSECDGLGDEIDPNTLIPSNPITIIGYFDGDDLCGKSTLDTTAALKYTYRTEGNGKINIQAEDVQGPLPRSLNPIALPGPLKLDIVPSSFQGGIGTYDSTIESSAFLSIRLRNDGKGEASIKDISLEQITPENSAPLTFTNCWGPLNGFTQDTDGSVLLEIEKLELSSKQRTNTITCQIDLTDVELTGELTTYIITGESIYDYQIEAEETSIKIDSRGCGDTSDDDETETSDDVVSDSGSDATEIDVIK